MEGLAVRTPPKVTGGGYGAGLLLPGGRHENSSRGGDYPLLSHLLPGDCPLLPPSPAGDGSLLLPLLLDGDCLQLPPPPAEEDCLPLPPAPGSITLKIAWS
ncbi:UNVERIFIED_CONTAM: hypothetical protein FKN15_003830 [Acipenser sinensis]